MDNQQLSDKQEWKTVKEYDHYEVNQYGQIRHKTRKHILKPRKNNGGYLYVCFKINGKNKNFAVHRIVANAFIPNPNNCLEVNHKDYDRTNNCVDNLEWMDSSENKDHAMKKKENRTVRGKQVAQYSKDNELITIYPTVTEAAKSLKCSVSALSNCCLGRTKTSQGFIWRFVESSTTKYGRNPSPSVRDSSKEDEDIV